MSDLSKLYEVTWSKVDLKFTDPVELLINDLAPVTRRDDWWASDGPREIIRRHFADLIGSGSGD